MSSKYPTAWLNCRFPFDTKARNSELEEKLIRKLSAAESIRILDLGAGNGSNYKYWKSKLHVPLNWTCLEIDPYLVGELKKLDSEIRVVEGKLEDLESLVHLDDFDLVMANALFDLFPAEVFSKVVQKLVNRSIPFHFTLNYCGMKFDPVHEWDSLVINLYHEHMRRPQPGGIAMGETGPEVMRNIVEKLNEGSTYAAESVWVISNKDITILNFLLNFMDEAIRELQLSLNDRAIFTDWLKERKRQLKNHKLALEVYHEDLLWLAE